MKNAQANTDVCHSHRNFYEKSHWLAMFTGQHSLHLLLGIDYAPNTHLGRIQYAVEYALNEGKVLLTEEDVKRFYCAPQAAWNEREPNLAALFVAMIRTGKVSPLWNKRLTRFCFATFAKMYRWKHRDILPSVARWIRPFLEHPSTHPLETFKTLLLLHRSLMDKERTNLAFADTISGQLIRECILEPSLQPYMLLGNEQWLTIVERLISREGGTGRIGAYVKQNLALALPQARLETKRSLHKRLDPIREELVAAMWHPSRVEAWLIAGDFELLEMMMGE